MGTPAFPNLGEHCSASDCNQLDFLPFTCDLCRQVFCLDHRSYSKHNCANATDKDVTVLVCPLCAKAVRLVPNEDPNVTWDQHVRTNCDPSNYAKVHKKPRCPVRGCREVLTFSNKMVCKDCKQEVCLKHRFGPDHNCKGRVEASKEKPWYSSQLVQSFRQGVSLGGGQTSSSNTVRTGWSSAASAICSSAEAGMSKFGNFTTSMMNAVGGASNKSERQPKSNNRELCPQCGAEFVSVSLLIQHVESSHNRSKPATIQDIVDLCPKCGQGFRDPISLVNHVERDHGGTSARR